MKYNTEQDDLDFCLTELGLKFKFSAKRGWRDLYIWTNRAEILGDHVFWYYG